LSPDARAMLVFFTSRRSGPARRMESLLAHIARKERAAIRVRKVDVDEHPDVAERFRISQVPSVALVCGKRVVGRLEGRSTAPKIEALLREHLERDLAL
jgi:thioredoxin